MQCERAGIEPSKVPMLNQCRVALAFVVLVAQAPCLAAVTTGWEELTLDHGKTTGLVYIPVSLDQAKPAPATFFFHGLGAAVADYASYLAPSAETAGLVLILVQSEDASGGWSSDDIPAINDAHTQVGAQLSLDQSRLSASGHSAGGAFAYLFAYSETSFNAVFTLSAPYYTVSALADTAYAAPILMCYGDQDPNYTGGSATALTAQWNALRVPNQTTVCAGYDHNTVVSDATAITAGFEFLVGHTLGAAGGATATGSGTSAGTTTSAGGAASGSTTGGASGSGGGPVAASGGDGGPGCGLGGGGMAVVVIGFAALRMRRAGHRRP
jgi:poly(3-hydroxybutyrate) depolymerase